MKRCPSLRPLRLTALALSSALIIGCAGEAAREDATATSRTASAASPTTDLLLVTLDTTRADALGFDPSTARDARASTPILDALAASGVVYSQAYTTAPMTLPAHTSMLTGLYPAEHGVHENARVLDDAHRLLAELLAERGYRTAAFLSGLPLSAQFGLGRGFDHYDDRLGEGAAERSAEETTRRALEWLADARRSDERQSGAPPLFLWVHYFDPHEPYAAPEPWRSREPDPYLAEIAYLDSQLGPLFESFAATERPHRVLVVGDHGEGRGDHGEALHGNLLYQGVMRVPMLAVGTGIAAGEIVERPVSVRRVFDTLLGWGGGASAFDLLAPEPETVLAEAMQPHLQYGWQPQVMAVRERLKVIRVGDSPEDVPWEVYDPVADPAELADLSPSVELPRELLEPVAAYPLPSAASSAAEATLSDATRAQLASLGYVDWGGTPAARADAPAPREMTHLFADLDRGSGLFVRGDYERAIPVFERVASQDPANLMVLVRLGVAYSLLGREEAAAGYFERAGQLAPDSLDVRHYLALHLLRFGHRAEAAALLSSVLEGMPRRLPALQALARIREEEGRLDEAAALLEKVVAIAPTEATSWARLGELRMVMGDTAGAIAALEEARSRLGDRFRQDLELGVLYLAAGELEAARQSLDRVPGEHPAYPMALFKRAQVSVLLDEPDKERRIDEAWRGADETTRELIRAERLFQGVALR